MSEEIKRGRGRPRKIFEPPQRMTTNRRVRIVSEYYQGKEDWEEYAKVLSRRLNMTVKAGSSRILGKWLEFELVKGIINRVYCEPLTEDGIFPIRHMVERFQKKHINHLYDLARERFFSMLWMNDLVIRELNDDIVKKFKDSREKATNTRKNRRHSAEEGMDEQREFELEKNKRANEARRRKVEDMKRRLEEMGLEDLEI